jgi:hypothetical protein
MAKGKSGRKRASPYFLFQGEKREEVAAKNPDLRVTEIAKEIGKMWKALSDSEKQRYKDKAAKKSGAVGKGKKE